MACTLVWGAEAVLERFTRRHPALAALAPSIGAAVRLICDSHTGDGKLLVCGNGGSAADSEHIVGELVKGFTLPRPIPVEDVERLTGRGGAGLALRLQRGVAALALTGNAALTTAIGNDTAADMAFAQQVYVYGRPGDILLGLSTSGNSRNVVHAFQVARAFGLHTIALTGEAPAALDSLSDICLKVPARETFEVQEYHLPVYHVLCLMIEYQLFGGVTE